MAPFTERVFSGVQPTGNLHLGNYLGALKRFVEMQATHPCIYCVVDLHAMTMPHDPAQLASTTREVTAAFLACGIDPKQNIVFNQSRVSGPCGARLDFRLRRAPGLAQPHDPVQGKGRQGPRERFRRAL